MRNAIFVVLGLVVCLACADAGMAETTRKGFEIQVVDAATQRGIPLVELVTVNDVQYVTDNAGRIAYDEPQQEGETIFFHVHAQGYEVPADGFGLRGVRLVVHSGASSRIELKRVNLAERLYRITGRDLYRDSLRLEYDVPIDLGGSGRVAGQDSVQAVPYRGKLYWFWGDTNRLAYPLGLFRTAGATSRLPAQGGLDPSEGIDLQYFTGPDGFARAMVDVTDPQGVVWLDGICTVKDDSGRERLLAHFSRRPGLAEQYEHGLMVYDDRRELFEPATRLPLEESWRFLHSHPVGWQFDGKPYLLMGHPFLVTRVPATWEAALDPQRYESWSCVDPAADLTTAAPRRDAQGRLDYRWQSSPPVTQREEARWLKDGLIRPDEVRLLPSDSGAPQERVTMHSGTVAWNTHRQRWILIAIEHGLRRKSPSLLGEVWYSEAESPQGPFNTAVRIVTHDKQSFYNPCHHAFFDQEGGRIIFFEGTYCNTFTQSPPTPRYNYNQIMYRLNVDHPALRAHFAEAVREGGDD